MQKYTSMPVLQAWRTTESASLPRRATTQAACWDVSACLPTGSTVSVINSWNEKLMRNIEDHSFTLFPGERVLIPTGVVFGIPDGYSIRIHPRSGLAWKNGITLANCEAVIDSDYVDETFVMLFNTTDVSFVVRHGDRIAQMELCEVINFSLEQADIKPTTLSNRKGGLGSTGVDG
jgi:dUTP pyrophosphatase